MQTPLYQEFEVKGYVLRWITFGRGETPLLAFHGFGQDASVFLNIHQALAQRYTVFAFQLFHHGSQPPSSHLGSNQPLDPVTWSQLIITWCAHQSIKRFSLLGYSLGGRLVLSLIPYISERLVEVKLLAPDGIQKNNWYQLATQSPLGKKGFYYLIHHPSLFLNVLQIMRMLRLISDKMHRFVAQQFESPANRMRLYNVWNFYKDLTPNISEIRQIMRKRSIRSIIITGDYDPILPTTLGLVWMKGQEPIASWKRLQAGHDLLQQVYASDLEQWL